MIRKLIMFILTFICAYPAICQNDIRYEYWIDENYANREIQNGLTEEQEFTLDLSAYEQGIHAFYYRTIGADGAYGILNQFLFYVNENNTSKDSRIIGYRYGFNDVFKYVKIPKTKEYEMIDATFPLPKIADIATINSDCSFTFNASSDEVKMQRSTDVTFSLQFENNKSEWSAPEIYNYQEDDEISHTAQNISLQKTVELAKVKKGDFAVLKLVAPKAGTYYLRSSQDCSIDIYTAAGVKRSSLKGQQLLNTAAVNLSEGTFYAIIYNTVSDANNTDKTVKIRYMLTNNIVPLPEISFKNGMVTINELQKEAKVYYTTDGTEPNTKSTVYSAPFKMLQNGIVKAFAVCDGYSDSDVATYKVDSYKTAAPTVIFTNLKVYITCQTPESQIYYTTDRTSPLTNGILYTAPVSVTNNCTVKAVAKRNGYNDSEVTEYNVDVSSVKCVKPVLTIEGNLLTMKTLTEGATIYYTTNNTTPTAQSERYVSPIILSRNATYKAVAIKSGEIQSDMAEVTVDWFQTELPTMAYADGKLSITCSTPGAIIYYTIGDETPTQSSARYTQPITLTDNRPVKAFAVANGFKPSDVVIYSPNMFTCKSPEIVFDGHAITVTCKTADAKIYYTTNGTNPTEQSNLYTGTVVLDGLCTVKAIAIKEAMNNSDVVKYTLPCYYNKGDVYIHTAGTMEHAFEWCGLPTSNNMTINGPMNDADFTTIRKLNSIEYLDLSGVTVSAIPDEALANMNLIYVSMPSTQFTSGSRILKGCKRIAAIDWNSLSKVPDDILDEMSLPNMLLFVRNAGCASTKFGNVVIESIAENIELSDANGSNFYCPRDFTARNINYKHTYSQKTIKNVCTGWESIALPFSPSSITHSVNGAMSPFAANAPYKKPFWLCTLTESGFVSADKMEANTPYIIAMPNNVIYSDEYILAGEVTFSGNNVKVCSSATLKYGSKGNNIFTPNFINKPKNECMTLNVGKEYAGHLQGSLFVNDYRDAKPFEAFITVPDMMDTRKIFFIGEEMTGLEELEILVDTNIQITLDGNKVVIEGLTTSGIAELYNISGSKLAFVKGNGNKTVIDCSAYKNHYLIVKATNNYKDVKTFKFNL